MSRLQYFVRYTSEGTLVPLSLVSMTSTPSKSQRLSSGIIPVKDLVALKGDFPKKRIRAFIQKTRDGRYTNLLVTAKRPSGRWIEIPYSLGGVELNPTFVTLEQPTIKQSECDGETPTKPTVTLPDIHGISFDISGDIEQGETIEITATPISSKYEIEDYGGWINNTDGTASLEITFDEVDCTPEPEPEPEPESEPESELGDDEEEEE